MAERERGRRGGVNKLEGGDTGTGSGERSICLCTRRKSHPRQRAKCKTPIRRQRAQLASPSSLRSVTIPSQELLITASAFTSLSITGIGFSARALETVPLGKVF